MNPLSCGSKFLYFNVLAFHYPQLRTLKRKINLLKQFYRQIYAIEDALEAGDAIKLITIVQEAKQKKNFCAPIISVDREICLDEIAIYEVMKDGIREYNEIMTDPPTVPCISCERLYSRKNVKYIEDMSNINVICTLLNVQPDDSENYVQQLLDYCPKEGIEDTTICNNCYNKLKTNTLPSMCILNNLFTPTMPQELADLNNFEKVLIQRVKAFQTIVKLDTVAKKNIPHYVKADKVKGRTFHLPLPLNETLKKICPDTDPLNTDTNLFIVVRSNPTKKSKIIWEDLVDIKKIWKALHILKQSNPLYSEIIIPSNHEELLLSLNNYQLQYDIQEDIGEENANGDEIEVENEIENEIHKLDSLKKNGALLTQKDECDSYYEQFTIYPLHGEKFNEKDSKLYQMLEVHANPYDNRAKDLDVKCFPDLFPTGKYGQGDERSVKLREFDFIRSKLTSKHPQFRLNNQYLFFCLFNSNLRQVNAGIFHKLNVTNPRNMCTAAELIEKLKKGELEDSMTSIFARLPGTKDYWKRVRNDLNCMSREYGPATWFITFSPGEWMWSDMAEFIKKVNHWENDKRSVSELIAKDPVSASIFFDLKFKAILAYIHSNANPIGKVVHFYYCTEFQGRGPPHYHCMFWIENAPVYGVSTNEEVGEFILQHVTCRIPNKKQSPDLHRKVMSYQRHKDNNYCMRQVKMNAGVKKKCRFGFPRPVTPRLVLRPVSQAISNRRKMKRKNRIYDLPRNEHERFINDYMPNLLIIWEGNMDAQYIHENSYTLTSYITAYATKGEKGSHDVQFSDIQNNKSLISKLWSYAYRVLNHRECGAFEAAYILLSLSLHATDRATTVRWLDVRAIRNRKIKPFKEIQQLDADATNLFFDSLIDTFYPMRPAALEKLCLYDFARWFDVDKREPAKTSKIEYYPMPNKSFCKKRKVPHLINHWEYNPISEPEAYFYGLLLLFQPWRDTDELRGSEPSYADAFRKKQFELKKAMKHHEKITKIKDAMKTMEELVQNEMTEETTESQTDQDIFPDGCVPLETEMAMKDFQDIADNVNVDREVYEKKISMLNEDQARVFRDISSAIKSSDKPVRKFVSGFGGTGKSFVIELLKMFNKIECGNDTAVAAPTGVAAFNVGGLTIHRLLQIPVKQNDTAKYKELSAPAIKEIRKQLENVTLIIIDEISMVSNLLLLYIHLRLCEIVNTHDKDDPYFGRIHIILFGDLLQLPPVKEGFCFKTVSRKDVEKYVGGMDSSDLWNLFEYDELTINQRQKNDKIYSEILSRIRLGWATDDDIKILNERKITFSSNDREEVVQEICSHLEKLPEDTVCLLPTRIMCHILNEAMLARLPGEEIKLIAEDSFKCNNTLKKKVNQILAKDENEQCAIERVITIKIGARVKIKRNIGVTTGLVNGSLATIVSITKTGNNGEIDTVEIRLDSDKKQYSIKRMDFKFIALENVCVVRKQFPFSCSYGITIHSSQGLSLRNACIDAGNTIFACGQTYVVLSRITELKGLHLINFDPLKIKATDEAILEYNRLRKRFRPNLQPFDLSKKVTTKHQISDNMWALSKNVLVAQNKALNAAAEEWNVHGLTNDYSDYVNATLQTFFNNQSLRRVFLESKDHSIFKRLYELYKSNNLSTGDIKELKTFVHEKYISPLQYDVCAFINDLFMNLPILQQLYSHEIRTVFRCQGCDERFATDFVIGYVIPLALPPNNDKPYTLQYICDHNFNLWPEVDECNKGCKTRRIKNTEIRLSCSSLILKLEVLSIGRFGSLTKKNYKINQVPTKDVTICNKKFKVVSAIFHQGSDYNSGSYYNMLRQGKNWIKVCNTHVEKASWPRSSKDLYMLFLERCDIK